MKKKEIDLFGILFGLIIGCVLGFFISTQMEYDDIETTDPVINDQVYGTVYTIQLGCSTELSNLNQTIERLEVLGLYYEIYTEGGKSYIFNSVYDNLEKAQNQKQIIESYGFNVTIRSDYILDLPKSVITSNENYLFYQEAVENLLLSMDNKNIIISDNYYNDPIDIEIFSNLTILMTIKNDEIKKNYQLNTFCLLLEKLK